MEQLNRIELRGYVGSIQTYPVGEKKMARFTLATSMAYKDKDGAAVIETTWHSVVAFENKSIQDLDKIEIGSKLYVSGRVRTNRFTGSDGVERTVYEVVASRIAPCEDGVSLACEM